MSAGQVDLALGVGFSTSRLQRISALMQTFIARGVIAGAVTLVARHGQIVHLAAHGLMDIARQQPMRPDTIFRLASMTKPVISVAILMLLEEGQLLVGDPVAAFLPTFTNLHVAVPNPAAPGWLATDLPAGGFHLAPAERQITLRDLLTHTSGLGSATVGPAAVAPIAALMDRRPDHLLADVVPHLADGPLSFQPGAAWEYSPLFAFDTLGRVVEIVSGLRLDEFLERRLFEPLGMRETTFALPADRLARVATPYERRAHGLQAGTPGPGLSLVTEPTNRYHSGGGGLAGTAADYSRFALMLAGGGTLDGQRVLGRKTVALMGANHIGQMALPGIQSDTRGYGFGLGVRTLENPADAASLASRGTFGWSGAFGTNVWIDPAEGMVGILLIQRIAEPTELELKSLWPRFQATTYQALDD